MAKRRLLWWWAAALIAGGCAAIPPEAPELSAQLGGRIAALEAAHLRLLDEFFSEKKARVDRFVEEVWVPVFAREFFDDPKVDAVWRQVVQSPDPQDRVQFITRAGPRLQAKINRKRLELIQPLEDLEAVIRRRLKSDYDDSRAINHTLTAFLLSAAKVDENRRRYLGLVGITDQAVDAFVTETDQAVALLAGGARSLEESTRDGEEYLRRVRQIVDRLKR
jgi:hypothetical protein